jgi:hypothetical protein
MEHLIYLVVKVLSAAYLLHKVFRFLYGKRVKSFWHFLAPENTVKEKIPVPAPATATATVHYNNIVGKSRTVYLEELPKEPEKAVEPVFSEDLEEREPYEEEAETTAQDVEDNLDGTPLPENGRFMPLDEGPDDETVSTGMTYGQISLALDVVKGKRTDAAAEPAVARMLDEIRGSELFNFLSAQAENEALVEKLIKENIGNDGGQLPANRRKRKAGNGEFDMDRYV